MCAQTWEEDTLSSYSTVQALIGHCVVHQVELTLDRLCVADRTLSVGEAEKRARLGRERLERTLARLLQDFAARWCESRGRGNE